MDGRRLYIANSCNVGWVVSTCKSAFKFLALTSISVPITAPVENA